MPLPEFATLEEVPEAFRPEYELKDGKAKPKPVMATPGGETALATLRQELKDAEKLAKDEKKRADALDAADKARKAGTSEEQIAATAAAKKLADTEAENAKLKADAESDKIRKGIRALGEGDKPLVPLYVERLDDVTIDAYLAPLVGITETGVLFVKDKDGKPTGQAVAEAVAAVKPQRAFLFKGTGSTGGGSEHSEGDGNTSAYDPVAAGKAMAKEQKTSGKDNALAFT